MGRVTRVFYASGVKGKEVRADGNGATLARGWYCREDGRGRFGPFKTKTEANMKAFGQKREPKA
ncbi:hypothetical protein RCTITAN_45 [Rhodobacter phage RcTitan]|uniref:Uncharacterized protein n=1 Tax=Rhodobacter phage RcTitan TaxID=1662330 RepID=A0A0K1LKN0_9CAUD|nr:hypothetical protein RCTITAN_45 [Rhodobacter phage RcTitan]AKU43061.1 hypothetical protein RCTITAN_45 [Rhodobacter phage RcTitan]